MQNNLKPCPLCGGDAEAYNAELKMKLRSVEEKAKWLHDELVRYQTIVKAIEFALGRKFEE